MGVLQRCLKRMSERKSLRKYVGRPYIAVNRRIWALVPAGLKSWRPVRALGVHLHTLIQLRSARRQFFGTFFFRNRPELELLARLVDQNIAGSSLDMAVLACSKGAEVYSIAYALQSARSDLKISLRAVDIAKDILEFAEEGVYALGNDELSRFRGPGSVSESSDVATNTFREQKVSIFDRMSAGEMESMFDLKGSDVKVKPQFRRGITWHLGDARDANLVECFGLQDIVVANRFLCHMQPAAAEACLRNISRLVKPGGYLFVSGVDLDIRSKVARDLGWKPVTDLIREIHDGDSSLRNDWPWEYWGLEPFDEGRVDWKTRYASVFQLSEAVSESRWSADRQQAEQVDHPPSQEAGVSRDDLRVSVPSPPR